MLVLSRGIEDEVVITVPPSNRETTILIRVVDVRHEGGGKHKGPKARIGFTAPREVIIHRAEIQQRIDETAKTELSQ